MDSGFRRRRARDPEGEWGGDRSNGTIRRQRTEADGPIATRTPNSPIIPTPHPPPPLYRIRTYSETFTNEPPRSAAPFLPLGLLNTETEQYLKGLFVIPKINTLRNLYDIDRSYFIPSNETAAERERREHASELLAPHVPPYFAQLQARLIKHLIVLTRMRHSFRRLAGRFLQAAINRQPLAQTDSITLEPIVQPLTVYDMTHRCRHCFEAKPLMIHIHNQLLYSAGGFNSSQMPRNPLTNLPFRLEQLTSIVAQLKSYGHVTWPILAFAQTNFAIAKFRILHEPALRYTAIMNYIYVEPPQYVAEELVDFIIVYANIHKSPLLTTDINMLTFAATHFSADPYLMCWRRLYRVALFYNIMTTTSTTYDTPDMMLQRKTILNLSRILLLNVGQYIRECRQKHKRAVDSYQQQQMLVLQAIMNVYAGEDDEEAVDGEDELDSEDADDEEEDVPLDNEAIQDDEDSEADSTS